MPSFKIFSSQCYRWWSKSKRWRRGSETRHGWSGALARERQIIGQYWRRRIRARFDLGFFHSWGKTRWSKWRGESPDLEMRTERRGWARREFWARDWDFEREKWWVCDSFRAHNCNWWTYDYGFNLRAYGLLKGRGSSWAGPTEQKVSPNPDLKNHWALDLATLAYLLTRQGP